MRIVAWLEHALEHEQPRMLRGGRTDRPQNRAGSLVVPVMEDARKDVGVAGGHGFEEAARDETHAIAECRLVADRLR